MTGWPGSHFLLSFLRLHEGNTDACMAIDWVLEKEEELLAEIDKANKLILKTFGHKKRSVGSRLWLRDEVAHILFGQHVHKDKDTLSYVTSQLHHIIEWVINGREIEGQHLSVWVTKDPVRKPLIRRKVIEYILIESRLKGLVGQICGILKGKR